MIVSFARAHTHAPVPGGGGAAGEALGRSRGGLTTKIHLAADGRCRPLEDDLPADTPEHELPDGLRDAADSDPISAAPSYDGSHNELAITIAPPSFTSMWGLNRKLNDGERVEAVGYVGRSHTDEFRPVVFWVDDGQPVNQVLNEELPARPLSAPYSQSDASSMLDGPHIIGIALLIGPAAAFDLQLLGIGRRTLPVTTAANHLLCLSHLGFVIAAATGVAMFLPGANLIADHGSAPWKLGLILLAGINILIFHRRTCRSVADWDTNQPTPVSARLAAGVSLISWTGVTIAGRLLAFT